MDKAPSLLNRQILALPSYGKPLTDNAQTCYMTGACACKALATAILSRGTAPQKFPGGRNGEVVATCMRYARSDLRRAPSLGRP